MGNICPWKFDVSKYMADNENTMLLILWHWSKHCLEEAKRKLFKKSQKFFTTATEKRTRPHSRKRSRERYVIVIAGIDKGGENHTP